MRKITAEDKEFPLSLWIQREFTEWHVEQSLIRSCNNVRKLDLLLTDRGHTKYLPQFPRHYVCQSLFLAECINSAIRKATRVSQDRPRKGTCLFLTDWKGLAPNSYQPFCRDVPCLSRKWLECVLVSRHIRVNKGTNWSCCLFTPNTPATWMCTQGPSVRQPFHAGLMQMRARMGYVAVG
jgi:hypothetical protein